jgi:hypothetical protein
MRNAAIGGLLAVDGGVVEWATRNHKPHSMTQHNGSRPPPTRCAIPLSADWSGPAQKRDRRTAFAATSVAVVALDLDTGEQRWWAPLIPE